jgi:hypothetical protein
MSVTRTCWNGKGRSLYCNGVNHGITKAASGVMCIPVKQESWRIVGPVEPDEARDPPSLANISPLVDLHDFGSHKTN